MFLLAVPLAFVGLTWWAAEQVRVSRSLRQGDVVALMSQPTMPVLNPYLPASEAERQLIDVIHAPLIKVGPDGRLAPGLASDWRWMKRVTVWFSELQAAAEAARRLEARRGEAWNQWKLESVAAQGRTLSLTFTDPLFGAVRSVLEAAAAKVQRVSILRIEVPGKARAAQTAMMNRMDFAGPVQRVWFDGEDAFEIAIVGVPAEFEYEKELRRHLTQTLGREPSISTQIELPTIEEPALEFTLRDARWHDGSPVTAQDVRATYEALIRTPWPLPNHEGLRVIRGVEVVAPNRAQVLLWRHYGPALAAWIGLPILPSAWWLAHPLDDAGRVFSSELPPGAGPWRVEQRDYSSMVIQPATDKPAAIQRLTLVTSLSAFTMQLGYSTNSLDLFWPSAPALPAPTISSEALQPRASPPQRAVQVLWNSRRDPLNQPLVREALSAAVDRRAVIANALQGKGRPQGSLFAPGLWLSSAAASGAGDTARAEQLLAAAGWLRNVQGHASSPNGTLLLTLLVPEDLPALARIAAELRLQWARPGIQIIVKPQPRATMMSAMRSGAFDGVVLDAPLATSWDLWPQWHSDEAGNITGFADRQVDLLLEALKHEFQPGEAAVRAQRAEALILASHMVLPLVTLHDESMIRASLGNGSSPDSPWTLSDLLARPARP